MGRWTLEQKRAIDEYVKVIKGNEAELLAMYQTMPYLRLAYSPKDLQKVLNSIKINKTPPVLKKADGAMTELCADNIVEAWNEDLGCIFHATAKKVQRGKFFLVEITGAEE